MVADAGLTNTEATETAVTITAEVPLCPSLVAVIVADPAATPVINPVPFTVAAAVLLVLHVTTRPVSAFPFASFGVAVSCTVCPVTTPADAGLTLTDATGTSVTVTVEAPLFPSLVAVIVTDPAAPPVARPLPDTVAAAVLLLLHVTTRPVSVLPFASFGVAVSCTVSPTTRLADAGLTLTDATGTVTVTAEVPLCPSLVAVIVADPAATPVTSPLPLTVAAVVLLLPHVTTRPVSVLPFASLGVAASCTVCPAVTLADPGLTLTDATGAGVCVTVIAAVPFLLSLVAVIVAEPAAAPVTRPLPFTVATAVLLLAHVTTRPFSAFPFASRGVAVSCTVCPVVTLTDAGLTPTVATGTAPTSMTAVSAMLSVLATIL
jgi:hypothetical protein